MSLSSKALQFANKVLGMFGVSLMRASTFDRLIKSNGTARSRRTNTGLDQGMPETIVSDDGLPLHILNEILRTRANFTPESEIDLHIARYNEAVGELYNCLATNQFKDIPPIAHRQTLIRCLLGTNISEAMWLINYLHKALPLGGDICEFGCAHGTTSALLANEISGTNRSLWLFDSFKGLSKPTEKDVLIDDIFHLGSMAAYQGTMNYPETVVRSKLAAISFPENRTHIVSGFIEDSLKQAQLPVQVCFAYVDFDLYAPILTALNFLADRMPAGAFVVVDDYGFLSAGAQQATDEFVSAHQSTFRLELPPAWAGKFALLIRYA